VTLASGDSLLAQAESTLADDRYRRTEAGRLARAAATAFERAARIAQRADVVDDDTNMEIEALILGYEGQFAGVGEALSLDLMFAEGTDVAVDRINATIASLYQERRDLRSELADTRNMLVAVRSRVGSLSTQLAVQRDSLGALLAAETAAGAREVAEETRQRLATAAMLEARQDQQQKIEHVRSNFSEEEAEVLLGGSELTITLRGLNFAVGSPQITPDNFQLLTRLQRSMREFPDAPIVITGHTDSQGNEAVNQGLSERRAQSVMQYLVANTAWNEDLISAVGFGASQPVSTNETVEGRAQNRRIDVIIKLPSLPSTSANH
jgi:outer membrane protein OmpA-like peptidoglycan-associated protein